MTTGEMPKFEDVADSGDAGGDAGITRKLVEEMVPFLRDPRPEIRQAAAATAVAASATKGGVALLHQCGAVKWLCRISGDVGTIGKDAVSALVNVSAEDTSVAALEDMCKASIVSRMMEAACDEACLPVMRDLCLQLLANVTRVQLGAEKVAQVGVAGGAKEGQYIRKLARWLALYPAEEGLPYPALVGTSREDARVIDRRAAVRDSHDSDDEDGYSGEHAGGDGGRPGGGDAGRGGRREGAAVVAVMDQWQHCASVLCNAARTAEGRKALRRPDPRVALSELLPQLSSANPVRRWGIAGCVRNCCFEELDHAWLLHEVKVVPHLLVRLSDDADEYDFDEKVVLDPRVWRREEGAAPRRREPVQCIKRDIVEALLQLCAILDSRQSLRKMGVYFVIRELDKSEPDGEISQVCYNLVNFLQRDEQDKQARMDYLKNLTKEEAGAEQASKEEKIREIEIMPEPGSPGSASDRQAFIRDKLITEDLTAKGGGRDQEQSAGHGAKDGKEDDEDEEEFVGDEGADAISKTLASFNDSDDEP